MNKAIDGESLTWSGKSFHNEGAAEVNDLSPHDVLARVFLKRCLLLDRIDWRLEDGVGVLLRDMVVKCLLVSDRYPS